MKKKHCSTGCRHSRPRFATADMTRKRKQGIRLRLLSYNIQAGIGSRRMRHMLTYSFRYLLPHQQAVGNLNRIAEAVGPFDIVSLQEADCGSFRSQRIQQTSYIAWRAGFPFCQEQTTRDIGRIASIGLGMLHRHPCLHLQRFRLPASRHGRGLMEAVLNVAGHELAVLNTHLSLRQSSRIRQMRFIAQRLNRHESAVLMGDFNCGASSKEMRMLMSEAQLRAPADLPPTFPAWQPQRRIDHILSKGRARIIDCRPLAFVCSDHLPLAAELILA